MKITPESALFLGMVVCIVVVLVDLLLHLWRSTRDSRKRKREPMMDGTGKPCPNCGHAMVDLRSMDARECSCGYIESWPLNQGQKPLVGSNRSTRQR